MKCLAHAALVHAERRGGKEEKVSLVFSLDIFEIMCLFGLKFTKGKKDCPQLWDPNSFLLLIFRLHAASKKRIAFTGKGQAEHFSDRSVASYCQKTQQTLSL